MITIPIHLEPKVIELAYRGKTTTDMVLEGALKLYETGLIEKPPSTPLVEQSVRKIPVADLQSTKQNHFPELVTVEKPEEISLKRELSTLYGYSNKNNTKTSALVKEACADLGLDVNGVSATTEQKLAILNWHNTKCKSI